MFRSLISVLFVFSCGCSHSVSDHGQCDVLAANSGAAIHPIDENPYLLLKGQNLSLACCGLGFSDIQWYDSSENEIRPRDRECHVTNIIYKHKNVAKSTLEIFIFKELGQHSYICKNAIGKYTVDFHVIEMKTTNKEIEPGLFLLECRLDGIPHNKPSTDSWWVLPNGQEGYSQPLRHCSLDDFCISLKTSVAGHYKCIFKLPTVSITSQSFEAYETFIVPNSGTPTTSWVILTLLLVSISSSCILNIFKDPQLISKRCIE